MLGDSLPMLELKERVSAVAPLARPVLVIGERGTGKELVAARLHLLSRRWERPLVALNCAALAENLLESELFGHEAGAFTGALRRRIGRFELADRSTLFLDEIGNATASVQEKLLRAIEYGRFARVGAAAEIAVDVRVVAATHADLPREAAAGRFRADLLDRLAFEVLQVPPLRARRDDIPRLAAHFGRAMALELGRDGFPGFTPATLAALAAHDWPGNVRELRNVVERAVYREADPERPIATLELDPFAAPWQALPAPAAEVASPSAVPGDFGAALDAHARHLLESALAAHRHNQRAAARALGLGYDQLRYLLKKHGLGGRRRGA
nr:sigma 54-interacting transcriptional regulator [Plasticicumulans lactativorans]